MSLNLKRWVALTLHVLDYGSRCLHPLRLGETVLVSLSVNSQVEIYLLVNRSSMIACQIYQLYHLYPKDYSRVDGLATLGLLRSAHQNEIPVRTTFHSAADGYCAIGTSLAPPRPLMLSALQVAYQHCRCLFAFPPATPPTYQKVDLSIYVTLHPAT